MSPPFDTRLPQGHETNTQSMFTAGALCIYICCLSSDTTTFEINTPCDHLGRGAKCKWVLTAQGVLGIPRSLNLSWARVCLSCLSVWLLPTCLCAGRPCSAGSAACAAVVCPRDLALSSRLVNHTHFPSLTLSVTSAHSQYPAALSSAALPRLCAPPPPQKWCG